MDILRSHDYSLANKAARIAGTLLLSLGLAGCVQKNLDPEKDSINWVPVSSPPNFEGQCYGFFITLMSGPAQHSFSSVECGPGDDVKTEDEKQLDWKKVPTPPNQKGPCYGYFITEGENNEQHSFSGTFCE